MVITFESLPVELIADILSELDLVSLITVSYLSRRIHSIASDSALNPWRKAILRNLKDGNYEPSFNNLCVRYVVPRQNWLEILSLAKADFLLFQATLPNLLSREWEECFRRRFLPGWRRWRKDGMSWKEAFMKMLFRMWHRNHTSCTADENWTKYIVLNRNGSVNELESSSRNFNPTTIFNEMKFQSNLTHLETHIRLVVQFADIRILAFGVLNRTGTMLLNMNSHVFLHPPGIERDPLPGDGDDDPSTSYLSTGSLRDSGIVIDRSSRTTTMKSTDSYFSEVCRSPFPAYSGLNHPVPALTHANYPYYTKGGSDKRWLCSGAIEEDGLQWVGGLMLTAQLIGPHTHIRFADGPPLQDMDLITGLNRNQYASFSWEDFKAIAPWMKDRVTKIVFGPGLGN